MPLTSPATQQSRTPRSGGGSGHGIKTSAQELSDELLLRDFGTFTVAVVSSTANTLELKVAAK